MAEEVDDESRTEDPTPRRREEARRQGQVPFSAELVGALVVLSGVIGIMNVGPDVWAAMINSYRHDLTHIFHADFDSTAAATLIARSAGRLLAALLPLFGILLAVGILSSVAQVGFQINTEKFGPNFDRLNPVTGASRLFSVGALVKGGLTVLKVAALALVAYIVLEPRSGLITSLGRDRLAGAAPALWAIVVRLALYLTGAVALVAVLDYLYQRYKFEQSLRMTKEELKRELKEEDGDPQIKARMRQLARERSRRKMLNEVPKATVVVTNPTHFAVALRYDGSRDEAPVVVARGAGAFAKRIIAEARKGGVVVVQRPALARAIYRSVKEGMVIPGQLFKAVAEVLAFVYKIRGMAA